MMVNNNVLDSAIQEDYNWAPAGIPDKPIQGSENKQSENQSEDFDWSSAESLEEEGLIPATFRWIWQPLSGYLNMTTPGIIGDIWQAWGTGEALAEMDYLEENIPRLKELFPNAPWPEDYEFDREKYLESMSNASNAVPTVRNIERVLEDTTGVPFEAHGRKQELARLSGNMLNISPGGVTGKVAGAVTAPATSALLESTGVPPGVADVVGMGAGAGTAYLAGKGTDAISNVMTRKTPAQLEAEAVSGIPPGAPPGDGTLPPTKYGTAAEILESLTGEEKVAMDEILAQYPQPKEPLGGIRPGAPQRATSQELPPITRGGEELGIRIPRPARVEDPSNLNSRLGSRVNPGEIYNRQQAGTSLQQTVRRLDNEEYGRVNELYNRSRELNEGVTEIHPDLVSTLEDSAATIESIPKPSSVQSQHLGALNSIIDSLALLEEGVVIGYKPINNQTLIEQMQSLRQMVDFDFAHGSPKNVFKPTINAIEDSMIQVSQQTGNIAAAEAIMDAKEAYRDWSTKFNNDYINPYRDLTNRSTAKLFDKIKDVDNFNVMRDLIGDTPDGAQIIAATQRKIAEKEMAKFTDKPRNIKNSELEATYRELESVLTPEQMTGIREEMTEATRRFPNSVRVIKEPKVEVPDMKAMQKYTNKSAEQIEGMMNTRSGIRELREASGFTEAGAKRFDKFSQQKLQEILREGKVTPDYTGDDLFKTINKKGNYDLIAELTSEAEAKALLEASKEIAGRKFTQENVKKFAKGMLKYKALKTAMTL